MTSLTDNQHSTFVCGFARKLTGTQRACKPSFFQTEAEVPSDTTWLDDYLDY